MPQLAFHSNDHNGFKISAAGAGISGTRFTQILDLRKDLQMFRLTSLMRRYPDQLHTLLVYGGSYLDTETMLYLFNFGSTHDDERERATYSTFAERVHTG